MSDILDVENGGEEEKDLFGEDVGREDELEFASQGDEAQPPVVPRDPGAPTAAEIETHNVTHLPHRSWCEVCVAARCRDKEHRRRKEEVEKEIPEFVFDYGFLGTKGETETQAVQIERDRRTQMLFAHHVPRKGMASEHGARMLCQDLDTMGYKQLILKCDNEPALVNVQVEVKKVSPQDVILENSPAGDSKANGAAEQAVRAFSEQFRAVRGGLQARLEQTIPGSHPVTSWMIRHSADLMNKYHVGTDGKTAYRRFKGKNFHGPVVEFGERVHYRRMVKHQLRTNKMDGRWSLGFYLGCDSRAGEAIVGTKDGVIKASTIRRVGAHRRWDAQGLMEIAGVPWKLTPSKDEEPGVTFLPREGDAPRLGLPGESDKLTFRRVYLKRDDFFKFGFTDGCPACKWIISGKAVRQPHTEKCRARMEASIRETDEGKERYERYEERANEALAREVERRVQAQEAEEDRATKRAKTGSQEASCQGGESRALASSSMAPSSSSSSASGMKRVRFDEDSDGSSSIKQKTQENVNKREGEDLESSASQKATKKTEPEDEGMEISNLELMYIETMMQEDFEWTLDLATKMTKVDDMCEQLDKAVMNTEHALAYFDEISGERLNPKLVARAEDAELARFKDMQVYQYVERDEAMNDQEGVFVKTKWVRTNKGTTQDPKVKC